MGEFAQNWAKRYMISLDENWAKRNEKGFGRKEIKNDLPED